jgi:flagellar hook-associated protein 1 FlgK
MPNLFAALVTTTSALRVFERALSVTQNNVGNASTPGYAKQRMEPVARAFDPAVGLAGGVYAGDMRSSRNGYAEQYVRRHTELSGFYQQSVASMTAIENVLTLSAENGIPAEMTRLFEAFSAWSQDPNSQIARRDVLQRAESAAHAFRHTVAQLVNVRQETDAQIRNTADQINALAGRLQEYNRLRRQGQRTDAGLDAKIHAALEELSGLVNINTLYQEDGTVTVLLGGQSLLVVGENAFPVRTEQSAAPDPPPVYAGGANPTRVIASDGTDVTAALSGGKLGGLLDVRNRVFPSLIGDKQNLGTLNLLAATFVSKVNDLFVSGEVSPGVPGAAALFESDPLNPTGAAESMKLHPLVNQANLPARDPGPPEVSNGIALKLAELTRQPFAETGELSLVQFYGFTVASLGRDVERTRENHDQQQQFVAQARAMRDAISGVSLDEEAVLLLEFQRAYQATARVVAVISELTEDTINMLR